MPTQKMPTQHVKGGNTKEFYDKEGTFFKSLMQVNMHPDVSRMVWRFGRCHHYVDYTPFKKNILIKRDDLKVKPGINNYGMVLKDKSNG